MLDDMREDDEETQRIIETLEKNIERRTKEAKGDTNSYYIVKWAIWDTFRT
jgi:hypothetical protein